MKSSLLAGLAAMAAGLFGGISQSAEFLSSLNPRFRYATGQVRSRTRGQPGKPGDKLRKKVSQRRLGIATIR